VPGIGRRSGAERIAADLAVEPWLSDYTDDPQPIARAT